MEYMKIDPVTHTKGYLGLDRYTSEQSRSEEQAGCILLRIAVVLMDPSQRSLWGQEATSYERRWRAQESQNRKWMQRKEWPGRKKDKSKEDEEKGNEGEEKERLSNAGMSFA